jgi:hypothetical protein
MKTQNDSNAGAKVADQRVEIQWHYFCKTRKTHVTEWLPGVLISTHSDGRHEVRADNGFYAFDASPTCARIAHALETIAKHYQP